MGGMSELAKLQSLTFTYCRGLRPALDGVTCAIRPGVTGLVGVNGAGKSTLLSLLAAGRRPTSGSIDWGSAGSSVAQVRRAVSWVPQSISLPRTFTVLEYLQYGCFLQGVPRSKRAERVESALAAVDLADRQRTRCGALSGGQARRLVIAWGLLPRPEILLLDEPTAGLDVYQRRAVRQLIQNRPAPLVVVASHLLSDVRGVADDLLVLDAGRLAYAGTMADAQTATADLAEADAEEQLIALLDRLRVDRP